MGKLALQTAELQLSVSLYPGPVKYRVFFIHLGVSYTKEYRSLRFTTADPAQFRKEVSHSLLGTSVFLLSFDSLILVFSKWEIIFVNINIKFLLLVYI